jgi:hypothetical protein
MLSAIGGMTDMCHHIQFFSVEIGSHKLSCLGWPGALILLISVSQISRMTGGSPWYTAISSFEDSDSHLLPLYQAYAEPYSKSVLLSWAPCYRWNGSPERWGPVAKIPWLLRNGSGVRCMQPSASAHVVKHPNPRFWKWSTICKHFLCRAAFSPQKSSD